jgi:hypothetical protein
MQSQYTAWITTLFVTGCIFTIIFLFAVPATAIGIKLWHKKTGKDIPYPNFWEYAITGAACILIAGTITLFILFFTTGDGLFLALGCASISGMGLICFHWLEPRDGELTIYFKVTTGGIGIIATLTVITILTATTDSLKTNRETENAKYNQTITYYIDANNHPLEGETRTYPVTSLRTNRQGTSYSWIERTKDGALTTRTIQKVSDEQYELTIKDDLPATDTEPRVERTVEYQVKGEEVAAGKEPCTEKYSRGDLGILPTCDKDKTEARFIKTRTIIHIPAGNIDKAIAVTSE